MMGLAAVGRKKGEKEDGTAVPIASKGDREGFIAEVPLRDSEGQEAAGCDKYPLAAPG